MSSSDGHISTIRLGFMLFNSEHPVQAVFSAYYLSNAIRVITYTLLGFVVAGQDGGEYAFIGSCVLSSTYFTVTLISDVPMTDKVHGTYPRLASNSNPFWIFLVRAVPHILYGAGCVLVCALGVGLLTGQIRLMTEFIIYSPILIPALFTGVIAGLFAIAPAIGTRYDTISYNLLTAVLTLFTGALIPNGTHVWIDIIGSGLPLTHSLEALRSAIEGDPWVPELLLELTVGAFWAAGAWIFYRYQDRRGRRTGGGAFN